ncbi:MAG: translocation/assembly module TamB domain-containing protein, partial [Cyanobacteria bacterium P01_C01_bin.118]
GSASLAPQLQYTGELTIAEGRIEDLVALVEKVDLSAFNLLEPPQLDGTAADLAAEPAKLPSGSLLEQLKAFAAFVENQPDAFNSGEQLIIPSLAELSGGFTGTIALAGDSPYLNDAKANFNIQGDSWQWGPYAPPNEFVIRGDVQELSVSFESVLITAGETIINLSGNGDLDELTGQLTVDNLPVELANYIYPLPVDATGQLDIFTQFDGSLANPIVEGQALIIDPQINNYPLELVETNFSYRNASLDIAGDVAIDPDDAAITLRGKIPYALPFMTVKPSTERLALKAVVPNDSFDVINTLTKDQVRWEAGKGEVVVQVDGTLKQPVVMGNVKLRNGMISSELLEAPITDLTGDIQFDLALLDEQFSLGESNIPLVTGGLTIPQLQANVQDGQLTINGELPLSPFDQLEDGIKIALKTLPVDYSGGIKSVFDGQLTIDGSVVAPVVGGNLAIGEGKVSTRELARQFTGSNADTAVTDTNPQNEPNSPINRQMAKTVALYREDFFGEENLISDSDQLPLGLVGQLISFNDFEIQLSDRLLIEGQPLFNLRASGDIVVDGTLANPRPKGEIELESGWINLFSTQFRLDRGEENKATFIPSNGIYPILNATMRTRVQETDTSRVPAISESGFVSSEVTENQNIDALGNVEYITIRASVAELNVRELAEGSTEEAQDQLGQVVILESDPSRSQGELIALLGNNVFNGITSAGLTQLAGFVGAGNVVGFLNNLADAIGFQSFSVFPTTDTATDSTAGIGIGVEAIFEVTDDINVSVLEILNNGNAPQFGLQYELTEELRLRGSSNLDDTEFRLEYRIEF